MSQGNALFTTWQTQVQPRIQYIRDAYLAAGVLEELTSDAKLIADDWLIKAESSVGDLAQQARKEHEIANTVYLSYQAAWQQVSVQMEQISVELDKFQDERLTLSAICRSLNIQQLSAEVLERVYSAIGPDTAVDRALNTARQAIGDLDAENRARIELQDFLSHDKS